ncbi:MAG: hypothetical protein R3280_14660 [Marinobacter sp.]|uniref:hypothetical protein n=1 Tax=Marinobacter sp. TaxID=50741 RepID=UPI00299D52C4|nr:hypothetical protein [Marinobacter sp.]MDX1635878.1 hypothetical protein [Marinobacter sp.]
MKKLHSLAFYALITPAITLGSTALLAADEPAGHTDLGEQDLDRHAEPENQDTKLHDEATKSEYNTVDQTEPESWYESGSSDDKQSSSHDKKQDD